MEEESLRSMSKRLGITSGEVLKKAAELQRLMDVRGCAMALTSVAKPVICLEIAAFGLNIPVDKVSLRTCNIDRNSHEFKSLIISLHFCRFGLYSKCFLTKFPFN